MTFRSVLSRTAASARRQPLATALVAAAAMLAAAWLAIPLPDPPFPNCYGTVVLDAHGEVLHVELAADEQWRFRLGREVSPKLVAAVQAFEDRRFRWHPGVDPLALARALASNVSNGEVTSGASTLTMQVARLMRPKARTIPNKLLEMAQSLKLETRYSKDEILRLYLTHAPYGGNLVGVAAASLHYFGRPPSRVTWAEAATLALLPNAPSTITPKRNPARLLARRNSLLERLHARGLIDSSTLRESLCEPLPERFSRMPALAPHLARRVASGAPGQRIATTLARDHQLAIEALASRHAHWLGRRGIHNLSLIAVDTASGEVRAYLGSPDFFDETHGGQVDGVIAPRSTGSILKPFLYALAFDSGLIHPSSLVRDVPVYFGRYAPVNADHSFAGMVRAREALVRSLNVPPTLLLEKLGVGELQQFLQQAGMSTLFRSPSDYGLALILGGAEGTLWDMAALYRGLALGGRFDGITVDPDVVAAAGEQLLSPAAVHMTLDILTEVRRPDDDGIDRSLFSPRRPVAWKTGTSYGKRDAWAVGVTPQWTVGVWVGNFSGRGNSDIGGAAAAAPILFDALDLLSSGEAQDWFTAPTDQRPVTLCADSGYRAGRHCPRVEIAQRPRQAVGLESCRLHRSYWIDPEHGFEVCSRCWRGPESVNREVRFIMPPDAAQLMRRAGHRIESAPVHNPDCAAPRAGGPVEVVYPSPGSTLLVPRDVDGTRQRVTVRAAHSSATSTLFWYVDGRFEGRTSGEHAIAVHLAAGQHRLQVVDQDGRSAASSFAVARRG